MRASISVCLSCSCSISERKSALRLMQSCSRSVISSWLRARSPVELETAGLIAVDGMSRFSMTRSARPPLSLRRGKSQEPLEASSPCARTALLPRWQRRLSQAKCERCQARLPCCKWAQGHRNVDTTWIASTPASVPQHPSLQRRAREGGCRSSINFSAPSELHQKIAVQSTAA